MATIAERLRTSQQQARRGNSGCVTCQWWEEINDETRELINEWIDNNHSVMQLHELLTATNDDPEEPQLRISLTGFRFHMNHHGERCRGDQ